MQKDIFLKVMVGLGIWASLVAVFGVWEYGLLKAEMDLERKILAMGALSGKPAYAVQMFTWSIMLLILGLVWSQIIFPKRPLMERILFSFVFGVLLMPISFVVPYFVIVVTTVFSRLFEFAPPEFVSTTINNIVNLFYTGQEQIYEFANVFTAFVIGAVILTIKFSLRKKVKPSL